MASMAPKEMGAWWRSRVGALIAASALALGVAGGVVGCSGGSSVRTPAPSASTTAHATTTAITPSAPTASPAPTITPQITAPAEAGASDICDQPASVAAQPPATLPAYPGAQLHVSFTSTSNGINNGLFGYCSSAQVSDIAKFYATQLPAKGWGSIQTYTLQSYRQVTASANNTQITITIAPDATQSGVTDILITAQGL